MNETHVYILRESNGSIRSYHRTPRAAMAAVQRFDTVTLWLPATGEPVPGEPRVEYWGLHVGSPRPGVEKKNIADHDTVLVLAETRNLVHLIPSYTITKEVLHD